jgi:hypothetical protein
MDRESKKEWGEDTIRYRAEDTIRYRAEEECCLLHAFAFVLSYCLFVIIFYVFGTFSGVSLSLFLVFLCFLTSSFLLHFSSNLHFPSCFIFSTSDLVTYHTLSTTITVTPLQLTIYQKLLSKEVMNAKKHAKKHDFLRQQFLVNGELEWRYLVNGKWVFQKCMRRHKKRREKEVSPKP